MGNSVEAAELKKDMPAERLVDLAGIEPATSPAKPGRASAWRFCCVYQLLN